ncbi:MAG: redoxin domain-containing protein [Planctomycetes bacterium]|nr:redoxin domain-containing protein [Planctomycetota bacterium]
MKMAHEDLTGVGRASSVSMAPPGRSRPQRNKKPMPIIAPGASAPQFKLDSQLGASVSLSDFAGKQKVLLVFYPLAFTPT